MEVIYRQGMMYPIEIANRDRSVLISLDDAKKLQEALTSALRQADLDGEIDEAWEPYDQMGFDLTKSQFADIARHFYELGCRHTAVMYDDIEYERQRAEEAELSRDLEEEVKRYWNGHALDYRIGRVADLDFMFLYARHFAEWGAEHAKK